jgi:hypothetical protein
MSTTTYYQDAKEDARSTAENFLDEIIEQLLADGKASNDLNNDYHNGDAWHHEQHVDKSYTLTEAAELLDELSEYEETDWGLWQGQEPREAISTQAAYTYGNAVYALWHDLIEEINSDDDVERWLDMDVGEHDIDVDMVSPHVDEKGKDIDENIATMFDDGAVGPAVDYASENGYKWSAQLQAGYRHEFLVAVREYMVRTTVQEVIRSF